MPRLRLTDWSGAAAPWLTAGASGLALFASHAPLGWWPATFVTAPLLVAALLLDRARRSSRPPPRAFRLGLVAGIGAFAPMLTWLIMPAGAIGWSLLVLVQAAWIGLLAVVVRRFLDHPALPLVAAIAWTGVDAWRTLFPISGFEWGAIAYAHVDGSWMLPVARLVGGRGITFLVVLISVAALVAVLRTWSIVRERQGGPIVSDLRATRGPVLVLLGGLLVSVLATVEPPPEVGEIDVLLVQGNAVRHWEIDRPREDPDPPLRITSALRDLTLDAVDRDGPPDLTIWPESSIDREPGTAEGAPLRALADDAARASGRLLAGASLDGPDPATERFVAALLLEDGFDEIDRYVKRRPVPFGEYIPMRPLFEWFPPLDQVPRDAVPGDGPQSLEVVEGVHAAVIICFETLFPDVVRTNILASPEPAQLIISVTNDASFGDSAEPDQHLAQTRLRAVETGRWAIHGALSGSSAIVDPYGGSHEDTGLFELATIRTHVPLVEGTTPYLRTGDVLGWSTRALVLLLVVLAGAAARRRSDAA